MLGKMRAVLFCALASLGANSWSMTQSLTPLAFDYEVDFELPAKIAKTFSNYWIWTITAQCTIASEDSFNEIEVTGLSKSGSVNSIPITPDVKLSLIVHSGDVLTLRADRGAQVQLLNGGPHLVRAHCVRIKN